MSLRSLTVVFALCIFASLQIQAQAQASRFDDPVPSDTVATADLMASFSVLQLNGGSQADISVELLQVTTDTDGNQSYSELTLSPDETILVSQGGTTVQYNPAVAAQDVLPYVDSGSYSMTFIRFNGETYTSTVNMPSSVAISTPADQSVYDRSQEVDIAWNGVQADGYIDMLLTLGCADTQGDMIWNDTSAVVPAGFAANCTDQEIDNLFITAYGNAGTDMPGLNGSFEAGTESEIEFIYPGPASNHVFSHAIVAQKLNRAFAQAHRSGVRGLHILN